MKIKHAKYFVQRVCRPIPILVAKVWRRYLDYTKYLQVKYFTSENIPIYGIIESVDSISRDDTDMPYM